MFKRILALFAISTLLATTTTAQTGINLTGRGLTAAVTSPPPVVVVGTVCTSVTSCPGLTLNRPGALTLTLTTYGQANGACIVFVALTPPVCPLVMPPFGTSLLPNPILNFNGIMSSPGAGGCPGSAAFSFPVASGTYWVQSVQNTPSGTPGWTTPIKLVL